MKRLMQMLLSTVLVLCVLLPGCGKGVNRLTTEQDRPQMEQTEVEPGITAPPLISGTVADGRPKPVEADSTLSGSPEPMVASVPDPSSAPPPMPFVEPAAAATPTPAPMPTATPTTKPKQKPKPSTRPASAGRNSAVGTGNTVKAGSSKAKTWTEFERQYPDSFALHGSSKGKRIALTFDDAPDYRFTVPVLDILRQHQVKATFFIIGSLAKKHPELVQRIKREGHVIGNHSSNHAFLPKKSLPEFERDLDESGHVLESIIGYKPRLFRPPYGAINEEQVKWAAAHHIMVVNWNIDSLDWRGIGADEVMRNVMGHVGSGAIVLQHAGIGSNGNLTGTVQALPTIIRQLKLQGYELVTLPELLGVTKEL